jgi:hypothetical protein
MAENRYFGLHVTRTAGTSLADMALRVLGKSQCLIVSSFAQMQRDNEQIPQERSFDPLPLFAFGHFVHESLWALQLRISPVFAFTVLREPRSRLDSTIRHYLAIGRQRDNIRTELLRYPNPTCVEILRCVPCAQLLFRDEPMHVQALAVLSAFDQVETMDTLPRLTDELLRRWNAASNNDVPRLNAARQSEDQALFDEAEIDQFVHEDQLLWNRLQQPDWRRNGDKVLGAMRDIYADRHWALDLFRMHLDKFLRDELSVLDIRESYLGQLAERRAQIDRLLANI